MAYEITYTVAQVPEDLPEGAEVKKISDLPLHIERDTKYHDLLIEDGRHLRSVAIRVGSNRISLTPAETVLVQKAISDALGLTAEVEAEPEVIIDGDGEKWYKTSPGLYTFGDSLNVAVTRVNSLTYEERRAATLTERTIQEVREEFGLRSN